MLPTHDMTPMSADLYADIGKLVFFLTGKHSGVTFKYLGIEENKLKYEINDFIEFFGAKFHILPIERKIKLDERNLTNGKYILNERIFPRSGRPYGIDLKLLEADPNGRYVKLHFYNR